MLFTRSLILTIGIIASVLAIIISIRCYKEKDWSRIFIFGKFIFFTSLVNSMVAAPNEWFLNQDQLHKLLSAMARWSVYGTWAGVALLAYALIKEPLDTVKNWGKTGRK